MHKTVIIVLISSLVVAIVVLPVVTSVALKRGPRPSTKDDTPTEGAVMRTYKRLLETSIRYRYVSASLGVASLFITFGIYFQFTHGTEFFPATEPDRATVALQGPDGTDLEATDRVVRRIEAALESIDNVDISVAESGVGGGGNPLAERRPTPPGKDHPGLPAPRLRRRRR